MAPARILVFSPHNAFRMRHMALLYDFAQVIAACDAADILAPDAPASRLRVEMDRAASLLSRQLRLGPRAHIASATVRADYDVMVGLFAFPREAIELNRIKDWRARCKTAVALINETWPVSLEEMGPARAILDQFDILYTATEGVQELCRARFGKPVRLLASGVDTLSLAPFPVQPARVYDVYAMGRSPPALTHEMNAAQARGEVSFLGDVHGAPFTVSSLPAQAVHKANALKRTRYLPCYAVNAFDNRKKDEAGDFNIVPLRFYEGAASGCVLFGQAPQTPLFDAQFPWQDAVIPCPADATGFLDFFKNLDADPARIRAIRARNVAHSLRLNDWVYRYEQILADIGLAPLSQLTARKQLLADDAAVIESDGLPAPSRSILGDA